MNKAGVFENTRDGESLVGVFPGTENRCFLDGRAEGKDVLAEDHSGEFTMEN